MKQNVQCLMNTSPRGDNVLKSYTILTPQFNPLTPMSDQDRISPYNINTMSIR